MPSIAHRSGTSLPGARHVAAGWAVLFGVILSGVASASGAQLGKPAGYSGAGIAVSLITIGAGDGFASSFGHNALRIRNNARGTDYWYDYGHFDFDQPGLLFEFLRGSLVYRMERRDGERELQRYLRRGREVRVQELDLPPAAGHRLSALLERNARPEHRAFIYDPARNNCSTRIRDILDRAMGGTLRAEAKAIPGTTLRRTGYAGAGDRFAASLVVSLVSGRAVDQPVTAWEQMFVPRYLAHHLTALANGVGRPLVLSDRVIQGSRQRMMAAPSGGPPLRETAILGLIITLAILAPLTIPARGPTRSAALPTGAWVVASGATGMLLVMAWALGTGWYHQFNENLLLFNPIALGGVSVAFSPLPRRRRLARWVSFTLVASSALSVLLKFAPGSQQNLEFLLVGIPANLSAAYVLERLTRVVCRSRSSRAHGHPRSASHRNPPRALRAA